MGEEINERRRQMDEEHQKNQSYPHLYFSIGDKIALIAVIASMVFSYLQLQAVHTSLEITAKKESVYLDPSLRIDAVMFPGFDFPKKLFVFNNGRIEAINVVIQIIRRQFNGESFTASTWGGTDGMRVFEEIKPFETKEIVLLNDFSYNTIEVRIYYMREYDKKLYSYRTFYFTRPEGQEPKAWYNIKQVKLLGDSFFTKVADEAMKLPKNLYQEEFENWRGSELFEL